MMNGNKRYTVTVAVALTLVVAMAVALGFALAGRPTEAAYRAVAVALGVTLGVAVALLWRRISVPFRIVEEVVSALTNKDYSTSLPAISDRRLQRMYRELNRIITLFRDNQNELETHRLYYERILRIITHEMRNTITPIYSLSDRLMRLEETDPDVVRESLQVIHHQTETIIQFLNQYHQLTHLPAPVMRDFAARPFASKVCLLLKGEPGIGKLHTAVCEAMTIHGDEGLLTMALINVLRNALQAVAGREDGLIELTVTRPGGHPFITVTDNGPGIPPELLEDIFLPFYSTRSAGSGIGLCLARQVMRLHGGDLTASSVADRHTTFSFLFP